MALIGEAVSADPGSRSQIKDKSPCYLAACNPLKGKIPGFVNLLSEIRIVNDTAELYKTAAAEFALLAFQAVYRKGSFSVALSGGSSLKGLYELLARKDAPVVPWPQTSFFFGNECLVPPEHADSNFRIANDALLSKVAVRGENVFRVRTEEPSPEAAARHYESAVENYFGLHPGQFPRFDLILMELGLDGDVASLFPGTAALQEDKRLVVSNWVEKFKAYRITFTFPVINNAACVVILVSGREKAEIVREVFENSKAGVPAQQVQPANGKLLWLIDRPAARLLSGEGT